MRRTIIIFSTLFFIACSSPDHPDATAICDCYTMLHHTNDEELAVIIADSCNNLYVTTLKNLEKDSLEMEKFIDAYDECR